MINLLLHLRSLPALTAFSVFLIVPPVAVAQLEPIETSVCVVDSSWTDLTQARGAMQRVGGLHVSHLVQEEQPEVVRTAVEVVAETGATHPGVYFCIDLPGSEFEDARVQLMDEERAIRAEIPLRTTRINWRGEYLRGQSAGARFVGSRMRLEVDFGGRAEITVTAPANRSSGDLRAFIALAPEGLAAGDTVRASFSVRSSVVPEVNVADLSWLAGCWRLDGAPTGSGEQWMQPAGGLMPGTSRTVRDGAPASYEFLLIRETDDGLEYVAIPSGAAETHFSLMEYAPGRVVFANPGHDFPQRIIYHLTQSSDAGDSDRLLARIEGERAGDVVGIDFPMHRVGCDGAAP